MISIIAIVLAILWLICAVIAGDTRRGIASMQISQMFVATAMILIHLERIVGK